MHEEDRHKLTIISHWESKIFNVVIMGYQNSPAYMQKMTNNMLWPHKRCLKVYMDNIVIFSKTLKNHKQDL